MKELPIIKKKPIESIDLVKYSGASGDFNEIHTVPAIAKGKGFSDTVSHGMLIMGYAASAINDWFPDRPVREFQVRFQAVTYPGTKLVISGILSAEHEGEVVIKDEQGEMKLKGRFSFKKIVKKDGILCE